MPNLSKKAKVFFCALLSLLLINFFSGTAIAAETITWQFVTVDQGINANDTVGKYLSLDYLPPSTIYMAYYDETNTALRFAECNVSFAPNNCRVGSDWTKTTVDNNGDVGQYASVHGKRISYYDATNQNLKFAWYVGENNGNCSTDNSWNCITVDSTGDVGQYTSLSYKPGVGMFQCGNLGAIISYYDVTNSALKYAIKETDDPPECDDFVIETVDNTSTNFDGKGTSIQFNSYNQRPAIAYYSQNSNGDGILKFAERVSGSGCSDSDWTCETASTISGKQVGQYPSLAGYEESGWVAGISHHNATDKNLHFTTRLGGTWHTTLIDANDDVGEYTSIAYGNAWTNGGPWHISYYDATDQALKYANGPISGGGGTCSSDGGSSDWDCYKTNYPAPDTGDYGKYTSIFVPMAGGGKDGGGVSNQVVIGYFNTDNNGDAKITFGNGPTPQQPAISEFKNYWYVAITAITALILFFIVRWQFKKKEVKK